MSKDSNPPDGSLIVVSNRLPYNLPRMGSKQAPKRNIGGLVNAIEPVLSSTSGAWIGWDGVTLSSTGDVAKALEQPRSLRTESGVDLHGVPLTDREIARYYHGFSNRTLWPLFHSLMDKAVFQADDYASYVKVNQRFAEIVMQQAGENDRLWVHDYHLLLLPRLLRGMGFRGGIDFFLHIPFPPRELFRALPWRSELIHGLLGADSVAFHIDSYLENFISTVESLFPGEISIQQEGDRFRLQHHLGSTVAGAAPIGVDVEVFEGIARTKAVAKKAKRVRKAHGVQILFGADRLDYTKGIRERLLAVERLLERYPRLAGKFVLVQVVVPSRHQVDEYKAMKHEIDHQVGRINGEFSLDDWAPIHYVYKALDREDLVARYLAASVALITPLMDGMNLVAPEFVASRVDGDGVLVLSEFAGVAEYLPEALRVNPYDLDRSADAIAAALEMPIQERAVRMGSLRRRVRQNSMENWFNTCLKMAHDHPSSPEAASSGTGRFQR